jgi:hypothetical protein
LRCQSAHCPGDSVCDPQIASQIPYPDRSPLYDVRNPAPASRKERKVRSDVSRTANWHTGSAIKSQPTVALPAMPGALRSATPRVAEGEAWWSQTGSNRRPHACKARALPAELWPHLSKRSARRRPSGYAGHVSPSAIVAAPRVAAGEAWWAWEDLNFRPHAYQARALTN